MNKILISSVLSALFAITFTGCSGKNAEPVAITECTIDNEDAPTWACGIATGHDDMLTATGTARMSKAGAGFSRKSAMADGRSNLSQQIETSVKDKIEKYARSTGLTEAEAVDTLSTQVSKQVANVTLSGSKQVAYWQHPKNSDIYVLMGISKESVDRSTDEKVHSSFQDQDARWQQFQADNALKGLDEDTKDR